MSSDVKDKLDADSVRAIFSERPALEEILTLALTLAQNAYTIVDKHAQSL